ncbi:MAG: DUF1343 domain-containing protein [Chitinispirillaceae bacterium]|nr:DUF1343 domain-containing protein [Chitinispirillaceae bacterium]
MANFGLDVLLKDFPANLKNKRVGVLCHAASINSNYQHILEVLPLTGCKIVAVFGPQHGLYGQTQDNMIEWEGEGIEWRSGAPIYSLYGKNRKPTPKMLENIDLLLIDLQDVGARPYTYIWTMKLCMEACVEKGIPVYVLDRPNPIGCINFDGPLLIEDFFSFVGGAQIPLCHRMTIGEIALLLKQLYFKNLELTVIWMEGWYRCSLWRDFNLPWVLPSPNMPTPDTAIVYPGMVLLEATNLSEGRGTTRPFELFGAPFLNREYLIKLNKYNLPGCFFREHLFIPTFQKWSNTLCYGIQLHITEPTKFRPVMTAFAIISTALKMFKNEFSFKSPPYEYEFVKLPIDILAGSDELREQIYENLSPFDAAEEWKSKYKDFLDVFRSVSHYPENM